jgi:hypothetical protein
VLYGDWEETLQRFLLADRVTGELVELCNQATEEMMRNSVKGAVVRGDGKRFIEKVAFFLKTASLSELSGSQRSVLLYAIQWT